MIKIQHKTPTLSKRLVIGFVIQANNGKIITPAITASKTKEIQLYEHTLKSHCETSVFR